MERLAALSFTSIYLSIYHLSIDLSLLYVYLYIDRSIDLLLI